MQRFLSTIRITTFAAILLMAAVVVIPSQAATVTSIQDLMSVQDVGVASNHTLVFTTPSTISEGSTITFTFDASFDTSSITEDDVDVEDDSTDLTTASDCTGSEQASVAMASDVLTITICAGDGGAIASSSEVLVVIGTAATTSGTGSNQMTNPSSPGTYSVRLAGGFGNVGNVWIPIISDDSSIPVSAVVSGGGGGGPGGDPPVDPELCGDTTAPIISGVSVGSITSSSAIITWSTNEGATSTVNYGETTSYGMSESSSSLVESHEVILTSLSEGTVYQFEAVSEDLCTNDESSGNFTFTTLDITSPTISNIVVSGITTTSATISWETDEATTGTIEYGLTDSYGSEWELESAGTSHSATITGLTEGTEYHFHIIAVDVAGNDAESADQTFTTLVDLPPGNVSGLVATPGDGLNVLSWALPDETDLSSLTLVWRTDRFPTSLLDGATIGLGLVTSYEHASLTNGTTYFYTLFVHDLAGQTSSGALASATPTAGDDGGDDDGGDDEDEGDDDGEDDGEGGDDDDDEGGDDGDGGDDDEGGDDGDDGDDGGGGDDDDDEDSGLDGSDGGSIEPSCGNDICEVGESEDSCPADCAFEVIEPPSGDLGALADLSYLVADNAIEIFPVGGEAALLPGRPVTLLSNIEGVPEGAVVQLELGPDLYLMEGTGGVYATTITTPVQSGSLQLQVNVLSEEETETLASSIVQLTPFGFTFESLESGRERIGYTRVTLFVQERGTFLPWDAAEYGQLNPQTTPQDGTFAWYVPAGNYYVVAQADGYRPAQTAQRFVTNAIMTEQIELRREPPSIEEVITTPAPPLEKLSAVAGAISENVSDAIETLREDPQVQQGVNVAAPVVLTTSVASAVALSISFDLLPFLQYLLTSPVLFLWRRRRKSWGVVYDAVSKQPVDLAIVRLYRLTDGRLVQSRVTDRYGRYFFLVDPGTYRIAVTKAGFGFPSEFLKDQRQDGGFLDLYHGEHIEVTQEHATIAANVPLDPVSTGAQHAPLRIRAKRMLRTVQHLIAGVGLLVALVILILRPGIYTGVVFGVQVLAYALIRRLAKPRHKPRGWGIVYDESTRKPLANVVVRVFEPVYNKLLATAVTDRKGRYNFLVGPSQYYARFERSGYKQTEIRPIDLTDETEPTDIAIDVQLKRSQPGEIPPKETPPNKSSV